MMLIQYDENVESKRYLNEKGNDFNRQQSYFITDFAGTNLTLKKNSKSL
jgi:hypothetical protein